MNRHPFLVLGVFGGGPAQKLQIFNKLLSAARLYICLCRSDMASKQLLFHAPFGPEDLLGYGSLAVCERERKTRDTVGVGC